MAATSDSRVREIEPEEDFLNTDSPIRGQEFVCISFLSPEKILEKKELFFFQRFMKFYEAKIRYEMLEKFLAEFAERQNKAFDLSIKYAAESVKDLVTDSDNAESSEDTDVTADATADSAADDGAAAADDGAAVESSVSVKKVTAEEVEEVVKDKMSGSKIQLVNVFESFRSYVDAHRAEVASKLNIEEAYKDFMFNKEQELDDAFHAENDFRTSIRGVKVRGSYSTHKEACVRAKKLQKEDPAHDVFVGQVGYWLPWDPNPHNIENQEYAEKELNELMKKHKEKQEMQKELFEVEKKRKIAAAKADAGLTDESTTETNLRTEASPAPADMKPSTDNVSDIKEARDLMAEMENSRIAVNPSQVSSMLNARKDDKED